MATETRSNPPKASRKLRDTPGGKVLPWSVKSKLPGEQWRHAAFAQSKAEAESIARAMAKHAEKGEGIAVFNERNRSKVFKEPQPPPSRAKKKKKARRR